MSKEAVEIQWKDGLSKTFRRNRDYRVSSVPGIGEDLIIGFYDTGGCDEFGFDHDGFDSFGIHMLLRFNPQLAVLHRLVRERILSHISRYSEHENSSSMIVFRGKKPKRGNCRAPLRETDYNI